MAFLRGRDHMTTPICRKILNLATALKIPSYATVDKIFITVEYEQRLHEYKKSYIIQFIQEIMNRLNKAEQHYQSTSSYTYTSE